MNGGRRNLHTDEVLEVEYFRDAAHAADAFAALGLQRGGVGYYRASDFVHLDSGDFRSWRG